MAVDVLFVGSSGCVPDESATSGLGMTCSVVDSEADEAVALISSSAPTTVVFALDGACAGRARELVGEIMGDPMGIRPLMVFTDGNTEHVDAIRVLNPYAVFVASGELPWILKRLTYKS